MAQVANNVCDICMRTSGGHYCTQCDQLFCADCKMSHLRSKISKSHIFRSGTNISTRCTVHAEDFIYLCADCDQLICRVCVTNAHTRHALVDIKDSNKKVQTEISTYLDSKVENVRSSTQLIEGRTKTYETEVEVTIKIITVHGNAIKEFVDKQVDALIKALKERKRIELQSLSKANKECKDLLGEVTRRQQIYQDMIKHCDEVALFQKMKTIKSDIANLKVDVSRLPSATYNRNDVSFSDVEKLFGNLTFQ